MSTFSKASFSSAAPKVDCAPRVEGQGSSLRYEFRSFDDLVECLEKGTFSLDVQTKAAEDFEQSGKLFIYLKGRYSDHNVGNIYVALKRDVIEERTSVGATTPSLFYELLDSSARNFNVRKEVEDTQEMYNRFLGFLGALLSEVRAKYFPNHSESLHMPKTLKIRAPKVTSTTKKITKTEVHETKEDFNLSGHVQREGKLMLKLGTPWLMMNKALQNIMMGLTLNLARIKYMTDEERAVRAKRLEDKKKEEEKAEEARKRREAGSNKKARTSVKEDSDADEADSSP